MGTRGRMEARVTVPTGGWTGTIDDSGGGAAATFTLAAGAYYLLSGATTGLSLIAAFEAALNAAAPTDTITVALSAGEAGTGKVTITSTGATAIVWVSTDLRDLLGFASNLASGTTWTSESAARGLWLPDCPYDAPNELDGLWWGEPEADYRGAENAAGYVFAHMGSSKVALEGLSWGAVSRNRAIKANETTTNQSWERFVKDGIWGTAAWATAGGPIRFYPDAADDAVFGTYSIPDLRQVKLARFSQGYAIGSRVVPMPRLVQVPDTEDLGALREDLVATALTTNSSTTDGTTFATAAITVTAGVPVYFAVTGARLSSAVGQSPTSITGAGLTFTKVVEEMFSEVIQARSVSWWRAMPTATATAAMTITFPSSHSACVWSVIQVAGADSSGTNGSGSVVQSKAGGSATAQTTLSVALDSTIAHPNNMTLAAFATIAGSTYAAGSGFAILGQDTEATAAASLATEWKQASQSAGVTVSGGTTTLGGVVLEIKAAAA